MSVPPAPSAPPTPAAPTSAVSPDPRRWRVAVVMMVAALMDLLDGTVLNVALPTIQRDLHASGEQLAWVVSAYLLAFAASLITAGQLGDRFGRRRLFLLGTATFGIASLASALAQTPGQLIAFRVV
jgi:MFS family permease